MFRPLICVALLVHTVNSMPIPPQVREMANPPVWRTNVYYGTPEKRFSFEGFPGNGASIRFTSPIYEDSAGEYLLPDTAGSPSLFGKAHLERRRPADFDSLIGLELKRTKDGTDTVRHPAVVHDGHWLFPAVSGKISVYSRGPGDRGYSYMQLPGRDIEKYRDSVLVMELRTNKASSEFLQKENIGRAGSLLMFIGGGILLAGGLLSSDQETTDAYGHTEHEFNASPLIWAGLGVMVGSAIPYSMIDGQLEKAIRAYNE
jgi:hypothetical protein